MTVQAWREFSLGGLCQAVGCTAVARVFVCLSLVGLLIFSATAKASPQWVKPVEGLTRQQKQQFWAGFSLFRSPWVAAPASTTGRDGLGPLFNARSCDACHHNGGGGHLPGAGFGAVLRLGPLGNSKSLGADSESIYGEQLQTLSIDSLVGGEDIPAEGQWQVRWLAVEITVKGKSFSLRKPQPVVASLGYGELAKRFPLSLRLAPPLFGLGDIERLSSAAVLANEDPFDRDGDGISGRANWVPNRVSGELSLGRYGHKAEQPNLEQQIAAAFHQDIGISSWLYPQQNCSPKQQACARAVTGDSAQQQTEITREKLVLVTDFSRWLVAPKSASSSPIGSQSFQALGCNGCHKSFGDDALFSDLLLHDMGEGLADGRGVHSASASEWRTMPLRGLSRRVQQLPVQLLHDGRAATVEQAILWHGGEGAEARRRFVQLPVPQRVAFIRFLESL